MDKRSSEYGRPKLPPIISIEHSKLQHRTWKRS
jgi:hypothetical protein